MTSAEAHRFLEAHDFSPRQARFLTTATLTAGFCLRRQYASFAGIGDGACVHRLFARLVAHRLAAPFRFAANRGYVYNLARFAHAIGHEEARYRVGISAALVARKVMLLDAVVSEPEVDWHLSEEDKVALFRDRFHVPEFDLPARACTRRRGSHHPVTRYFMERLPIGLVGETPTVHFLYLATTDRVQGFEHFLGQHAPLLSHLPRWALVVSYPSSVRDVSGYRQTFEQFEKRWPPRDTVRELDALRWYFKTWRAVDDNDRPTIALTDASRFHKLRRRFSGARIEIMYRHWRTEGDAVFERPSTSHVSRGHLVLQRLDHGYDQFGPLPGEC